MATYEELRAELATIAPFLIPVNAATASAVGTTAYLVDTALWTDPSSLGLTSDTLNSMFILRPDAALVGDRERRVGGNSGAPLDIAQGRLYPVVAWTNAPQSGEQYDIWALSPRLALNILNTTMARFYQTTLGPVAGGNDEDMEEDGVSHYSTTSGNALTKVSTAGNVFTGKQSLFFNASGAGQYVQGATYRVVPGQSYRASSTFRVEGGPAALAIWDVTNATEIEPSGRSAHSLESFMVAERIFRVPLTCEELALRWYATNASDDVYIDHAHAPRKISDLLIDLPSWLDNPRNVRKVSRAWYELTYQSGRGRIYDARSRIFDWDLLRGRDYDMRVNPNYANPYRLEFDTPMPFQELWVEGLRKGLTTFVFTAAGETSPTTSIDKRLIALDWAVRLCEYVLSYRPDDPEAGAVLAQYTMNDSRNGDLRPRGEYGRLLSDYEAGLETSSLPPRQGIYDLTRI